MPPSTLTNNRFSHLNFETEGVIDYPDIENYVFVQSDHPIVAALQQVPHSLVRVQASLIPRGSTPSRWLRTPAKPIAPIPLLFTPHDISATWYRVQRGVFYATCEHLRASYDLDEHMATLLPRNAAAKPPLPMPAPRRPAPYRRRSV